MSDLCAIGCEDAEEDPGDLSAYSACFDFVEQVVILLIAKTSFQLCAACFAQQRSHLTFLFLQGSFFSFGYKAGGNVMLAPVGAVLIPGATLFRSHLPPLPQLPPHPMHRLSCPP